MNKLQATPELLKQCLAAQRKHLQELLASDHDSYSDDGWDYLNSATRLFAELMSMSMNDERGLASFGQLLNDQDDGGLQNYACDGVAPIFYDIKAPSLNPNDED